MNSINECVYYYYNVILKPNSNTGDLKIYAWIFKNKFIKKKIAAFPNHEQRTI